jgi:hypothetical protein
MNTLAESSHTRPYIPRTFSQTDMFVNSHVTSGHVTSFHEFPSSSVIITIIAWNRWNKVSKYFQKIIRQKKVPRYSRLQRQTQLSESSTVILFCGGRTVCIAQITLSSPRRKSCAEYFSAELHKPCTSHSVRRCVQLSLHACIWCNGPACERDRWSAY